MLSRKYVKFLILCVMFWCIMYVFLSLILYKVILCYIIFILVGMEFKYLLWLGMMIM